jgi:hypothetical protein
MDLPAISVVTIVWLVLVTLASAYLCYVIYSYIKQKAPITQTVIDLIYKDCVICLFLLTTIFALTLIGTQLSEDYTLTHTSARVASNLLYFFMEFGSILMSVSSLLRLLTIINNSEEAGIFCFLFILLC